VKRPLGLRQRLTILYVSFFAILLLARGWMFRETLSDILHRDAEAIVEDEFAAAKRFVQFENGRVVWSYDRNDPDEARVAQSLQRVFLLADGDNRVLQASDEFSDLGANVSALRKAATAGKLPATQSLRSKNGTLYLVRSGIHQGTLLLSIGRPLRSDERVIDEFTKSYYYGLPLAILTVAALGWIMAGRALGPLNAVSQAARTVTSSNFSVRLERRGANDELDHLIDAFNAMVDRLESSFTQMRQFSANASHELRTPLTAVRGQLEVALFTATTPEQYREAIMTAIEDVDHLSDVVKALLHLSQAESGQIILAREPVDLGALVEKVFEQFQLPAEAQGVRLQCRVHRGFVTGDRMQLQRLISNLLSNALKFTPAGGSVRVEVIVIGDVVELVVNDTGCGISPEHLSHIFERFYRVPDSGRQGERGLGLGLSFVNWIAKEHHARIVVDSQPGEGTRFIVRFPLLPQLAAAPEPIAAREAL
jgi:heavy metal sensor kinase